jgi:hypothetical protein
MTRCAAAFPESKTWPLRPALGHAVFDFVAAEYGAQGIRAYLAALRDGPTVRSDAIPVAFGVSTHDFNAAFQRYVRTRFADRQDSSAARR